MADPRPTRAAPWPTALRLIPASHAGEAAPHVVARGGWVMTGLAADLCAAALGRPQTLALCAEHCPQIDPADLAKIRKTFEAAAAGADDLGGAEARAWLVCLDAARKPADLLELDAPAPSRPVPEKLHARAAGLVWREDLPPARRRGAP